MHLPLVRWGIGWSDTFDGSVPDAFGQPVKGQVDDGSGEQGERLAENQSANNGNAQRLAKFRAGAAAQGQRQTAHHGGRKRSRHA